MFGAQPLLERVDLHNGVRTTMAFTRQDRRGVIVLTNGEASVDELAGELYARLVESRRRKSGRSP